MKLEEILTRSGLREYGLRFYFYFSYYRTEHY